MEHNPNVDAALAAEFETDRKAFEALSPEEKTKATARAKRLYWYTGGVNNLGYKALRSGDDALKYSGQTVLYYTTNALVYTAETLKWAFYGPYIAVGYIAQGTGWLIKEGIKRTATGTLTAISGAMTAFAWLSGKGAKRAEKSRLIPNRWRESVVNFLSNAEKKFSNAKKRLTLAKMYTRRAIEKAWNNTKYVASKLGTGLMHGARLFSLYVMYKPLVWAFNPRWSDGSPLFGSERNNIIFSRVVAGSVLVASGGGLVALKGWLFTLHGSAGASVLMHAAISGIAKASTFVVLPVIAAAKRGLKTDPAIKAMAYQYELIRRQDHADHAELEAKNGVTDLTFASRKLRGFFMHIKDETVPAFFEHGIVAKPASTHTHSAADAQMTAVKDVAATTSEITEAPARQPRSTATFKSTPKNNGSLKSVAANSKAQFFKAVGYGKTDSASICATLPARLKFTADKYRASKPEADKAAKAPNSRAVLNRCPIKAGHTNRPKV